jgi:hypothetical protein
MVDYFRLTKLSEATPNVLTKDIRFILMGEDKDPIPFIARYGVVAQIANSLGSSLRLLQMGMEEEGHYENMTIDRPQEINVQKDDLYDRVLVRITDSHGVPYIFELPCETAGYISDLLKTESEKKNIVCRA